MTPSIRLVPDRHVTIYKLMEIFRFVTALLVSIRAALQVKWQKPIFGSQSKDNELAASLE
jgi:hypothetical protein